MLTCGGRRIDESQWNAGQVVLWPNGLRGGAGFWCRDSGEKDGGDSGPFWVVVAAVAVAVAAASVCLGWVPDVAPSPFVGIWAGPPKSRGGSDVRVLEAGTLTVEALPG